MIKDKLRSYLKGRGVDEDAFDEFAALLCFPPRNLALNLTYQLLPKFVQAIQKISEYYKSFEYNDDWEEIAKIISETEVRRKSKDGGRSPLWGYFEEHGIYVALSVTPDGGVEEDIYLELLAHVAIASFFVRKKAAKQKEYRNVLKTAPAALRKMSDPPHMSYLSGLDTQCRPVKLRQKIKASQVAPVLEPVCTLLGYVLNRSAPERSPGVKKEKKTERLEFTEKLSDLDDSNTRTPQIHLLKRKQIVTDPEEKMLAKDEILHRTPDIWLRHDLATNKLQTISQSIWRSKAESRTAMQKKNQCLLNHWHNLSPIEIRDLWESIGQRAQNNSQELEIEAIIVLMVVTGQKIETILNFKTYQDRTNFSGMGLLYEQNAWFWVSTPYQSKVKKPALNLQVMPTSKYLILDLPLPVQNLLQQTGMSFFNLDAEYAGDNIKQLLSKTNKNKHTRLTIDRVSNFLLNAIQHCERADITTAMMITGREAYTGTVPAHYTQQQINRLNIIYTNFWESVLGHTQPPSLQRHDINNITGSVFAPQRDCLITLVEQLYKALEDSMCTLKSSPQDLLPLHNNFTRYVAIMVAYATGIRAVTNPIPRFSDIDYDTGLFVLRDKDSEDGYHTRLMWCAPMCAEQLQLYWQHINKVVHKIGSGRPDFYSGLTYDHNGESEVFFIQADKTPVSVTPQLLHAFNGLPCSFNLPDNAHRHYLRSTLLERNCPPEVLNAYMGHWSVGEEPWGKYSSLSAYNYRKHLAKHIPIMLNDLGFKVFNPD